MPKRFNKLSAAEEERLHYFIEECSEAIQAACKVLRHGYDSFNPFDVGAGCNRVQLANEIDDIRKAISLLQSHADVTLPHVVRGVNYRWFHYHETPETGEEL